WKNCEHSNRKIASARTIWKNRLFIDNSHKETRDPLLSTSQIFNISISSAEDLTTLFLAKRIKKFRVALNYSSFEENSETEQENDFEDLSSIRDTGLLDDIELEDSNIEEETILSFKTFTLPYTAITALLIFIKALVFNDDPNFSETLYKAKDAMSFKKTIIQFIVYKKCHFLTNLESISDNSQANCSECKTLLKKLIRTSKGKIIYKPIKIYPYQSILSQLAAQPGLEELLEFYIKKKTIFVSLIPGPKEPLTEKINLYLDPLVDELKQLWAEHKIIAEKLKYSVSSECKQLFDQYTYKIMKIWTIKTDLISRNQLINIQNIVNNSPLPASIGRIPHKIASSFSGFTSD
ncbi:4744_t:CDS:2, partial [Gigaspora margarita]